MPERVLWELFTHARAEQTDMAREIGREVAGAMMKTGR